MAERQGQAQIPGALTLLLGQHFSPASFLKEAARFIALENPESDLSGITVLLPNLHAAQDLALELGKASGHPYLMLPQMTTLSELSASVEFSPQSRRIAKLYLALREKGWFEERDLWRLSSEIAGFFDELTRWKVDLPSSLEDFCALLEAAYQATSSEPLMFEARLIHELWHAMELDETSEAAARQLMLAQLAQNASNPLYVLSPDELTPAEMNFLEAWSSKAPVRLFHESRSSFFTEVWPIEAGGDLKTRCDACIDEPLSNLSLFRAKSLEEEAEAAAIKVRQWLIEGKKRIGLIALDRLAARRTRALLERSGILVEDETGWTFSTTSASTAIVRLLDAVASDYYHEDLLDLLKSPFVFSSWAAGSKNRAVHAIEQEIRSRSVVSGLAHYARLDLEQDARNMLEQLGKAASLLSKRSNTLENWLAALTQALDMLGISEGLAMDPAGEALLEKLAELGNELAGVAGRFGFRAWRRWIDMQFESMTFRDTGIRSPVVLTHLRATRLRAFDCVVLLGSDAAHLPAEADPGLFFNQAVRAELKLPLLESERLGQLADLIGLLCRSSAVWASWQSLKKGEPNLLSPYLEQLNAFHLHAFGFDLVDREFSGKIPLMRFEREREKMQQASRPAPAVPHELIPESISASGYNSLLACPYQYFAARILGLSPLDEADKAMEKADFGSHLHRILYLFHKKHPAISGLRDAQEKLEALTDEVFEEALEADYLALGWALRWKPMIPEYLEWQRGREKEGWKIAKIEADGKADIPLSFGTLTLRGRIDRVDESESGIAVIDYKTQSASVLREKARDAGEDVQLACYELLLGEKVFDAAFLAIDKEVKLFSQPDTRAQESLERLADIFEAMHDGRPLPAQGLESVCRNCDMRGLCRKAHWE